MGVVWDFSYVIFSAPFCHVKFISCLRTQHPFTLTVPRVLEYLSQFWLLVCTRLFWASVPVTTMTGLPWVVSAVAVTGYHALMGSGAIGVCFD